MPPKQVFPTLRPPSPTIPDQINDDHDILCALDMVDALEGLPGDLTRGFGDLRELDAVLNATTVHLTSRLENLTAVLRTSLPASTFPSELLSLSRMLPHPFTLADIKPPIPSTSNLNASTSSAPGSGAALLDKKPEDIKPCDRFQLLLEIAEELTRFKVGVEDKIKVAGTACEQLHTTQTHINSLFSSSTLLLPPPSPPSTQTNAPQYPFPAKDSLKRGRGSPMPSRAYPISGAGNNAGYYGNGNGSGAGPSGGGTGDTPTKKRKKVAASNSAANLNILAANAGQGEWDNESIKSPTMGKKAPAGLGGAGGTGRDADSISVASGVGGGALTAQQKKANTMARKKAEAAAAAGDGRGHEAESKAAIGTGGKRPTPSVAGSGRAGSVMPDGTNKDDYHGPGARTAKGKNGGSGTGHRKTAKDKDKADATGAASASPVTTSARANARKAATAARGAASRYLEAEEVPLDADLDMDANGEGDDGADGEDGGAGGEQMVEVEGEADDTLYCYCQKTSFGEMIGCDADDCQYEWFHLSCLDLDKPPDGDWRCPDCAARLASKNKGGKGGKGGARKGRS